MNDRSTEYLEQLIMNYDYHELDRNDKLWVDEAIGGEKAYQRFKVLFYSTAKEKEMKINVDIKEDLISKMKSKKVHVWLKVIQYKIPAYAAVILICFFLGLLYFLGPKQKITIEKEVLVASEPVIDTLIVNSKTDTIFIDKVRVVKVPVHIKPKKRSKIVVSENNKRQLQGKSLADQEELRDLLISSD